MTAANNAVNFVNVEKLLAKVFEDGTIVETIYDPQQDTAKFVIAVPNGEIREADNFLWSGIDYRPLLTEDIRKGHVLLPTGYTETVDPLSLFEDVQQFVHKYVELDRSFEEIAVRYIFLSHVYDAFPKVPLIRIVGPPGTGKSRFLNVMGALCLRSVNMGEAFTPAGLFRLADKYPGTWIMDEATLSKTEAHNTITKLLNGGYDANGSVARNRKVNGDFVPQFFNTFGTKVIGTRQPFSDDALESRILSCNSKEFTRTDIHLSIPANRRWEEAAELRNRLLAFRLENWHKIDPFAPTQGLEGYSPRLREIATPLLLAVSEYQLPGAIGNYFDVLLEDRRSMMLLSDDGMTASVIIDIYNTRNFDKLTNKEITKRVNSLRKYSPPLSYRKVGEIIAGLGFLQKKSNQGYVLTYTHEQMRSIAERYGLYFCEE